MAQQLALLKTKTMTNKYLYILVIIVLASATACKKTKTITQQHNNQKIVVYQVMTRLFGNQNTTNKPWGTKDENGVGKFNHFTDKALIELHNLGITHIWYTGVPHHAVIGNYTNFGITNDDPDVVKGRAGSPYAVKDYYNVNPDLAVDVNNRLAEFEALIARTHQNNMKVIIDIVPNHVARHYKSVSKPDSVADFGQTDNTNIEYHVNNNFYYITNQHFKTPETVNNYKPLGGEPHPLADNKFDEYPAKWTGNGSRKAQPDFYDWYETVKINYGIRPDGTKDFDTLPKAYADSCTKAHFNFWINKTVPNSWKKYRDICLYWIDKGVDGFRYDVAEMVPVEFWSYLNSSIKRVKPDAFLLAEIYTPPIYRDYIKLGKMDYLYDKVDLYDTLRHIMQQHGSTDNIDEIRQRLADIDPNMLRFLENHDEQRIASKAFAGDARLGMPGMVVSACIGKSPIMIYFGQEVGEPGNGNPGFGTETRTTIFDYWGVPAHQRWMNNGAFDGGQLTTDENNLRQFYKTLLTFTRNSPALMGNFEPLHQFNREFSNNYNNKIYSFARWCNNQKLVIVTNFDALNSYSFKLQLTPAIIEKWELNKLNYTFTDIFTNTNYTLKNNKTATIDINLNPAQSVILKLN